MCRSGQRRSGAMPHRGSNGCCSIRPRASGSALNEWPMFALCRRPMSSSARAGSRRIDIQAAPKDGTWSSRPGRQRTLETIKFPLGYHAILQGPMSSCQSTQESASLRDFRVGAILCCVHLSFRSWRSQPWLPDIAILPWSAACWARLPWRHHHLGVSPWAASRSWDRPRGTAS